MILTGKTTELSFSSCDGEYCIAYVARVINNTLYRIDINVNVNATTNASGFYEKETGIYYYSCNNIPEDVLGRISDDVAIICAQFSQFATQTI